MLSTKESAFLVSKMLPHGSTNDIAIGGKMVRVKSKHMTIDSHTDGMHSYLVRYHTKDTTGPLNKKIGYAVCCLHKILHVQQSR
jgi:hypothetical protein